MGIDRLFLIGHTAHGLVTFLPLSLMQGPFLKRLVFYCKDLLPVQGKVATPGLRGPSPLREDRVHL